MAVEEAVKAALAPVAVKAAKAAVLARNRVQVQAPEALLRLRQWAI